MVRWLVVAALIVSLGICAISEVRARQKYALTQHLIARRQGEIQKLADIDHQVQAFKKQKDALQRRIDILQQLYTAAQRGAH